MRISRRPQQNGFDAMHPKICRTYRASMRAWFYPKAAMLLLLVFVICAFAQAVQLNMLLADAHSAKENIAGLRAEQELLSSGFSSYFGNFENHRAT